MADPQQLDFSSVGGKPVAVTPPAGGLDFSSVGGKPVTTDDAPDSGAKPSTGNVQPPVVPPPSALSRFGNSAAEAMGKGSLGNTNAEVKQRLKEIAQHPIDSTLQFGKGVADAQGELAYKAKDAWQKGDHVGAAAYALYYMMPGIGPALAKSGEQLSSGDIAGGAGTFAGTVGPALATEGLKPETSVPKSGFSAAQDASARDAAVKPAVKSVSAEETTPKSLPAKEAGQTVQAEAKATRDAAGKRVGAAKETALQSVEDKAGAKRQIPSASDGQTKALQKLSAQAKPEVKPKALASATDTVLKDTADAEQLAGAKDPDMADVRAMADHLSKGQNAAGDPLSLDADQVDSMKRAFNQKIDALSNKAEAGGNATALRHLKNLKQAWQEDLYDAYEQHGDPAAAQALKAASKEYAGIVNDQTSGPARMMFKNQSPEKIVSTIVNSGARSQSAVESFVRNMSKDGQATLRDSVLKEIYRKNTLPDGTIDMVKARKNFYSLGDTGKTLYGSDLKATTDYLDAASKEQAARNAKAANPSIVSKVTSKLGKATGAGVGAGVGSIAGAPGAVGGAIAGSEIADAVFQNGKSGAVKIGISPTERIVLSPAEAAVKRPLITKFLKAKAAGNASAIAAAYNAVAQPVRKTDK